MSDKLNTLVASRVMGWPTIDFAANACNGGYVRAACAFRGNDHPTDRCGKWEPSTSIAAAWEVVEHLRKQTKDDGTRKYLVSIIDSIGYPEVQIETICGEDYNSWSGPCEAKSICCAALLAVGVPEATIQEACK